MEIITSEKVRSANPLKIGMAVSLSGQFQVQGRQALAGLQAWANDVTADDYLSFELVPTRHFPVI